MFIVNSYLLAIVFCFITMLCWGSWGNTQKLAGKTWRYELFYWDYVIGIVLFSIVSAFTLGSIGSQGRSFIPDLCQADWGNIGSAFLGGIIFNAANILLSAAIAIAGLSVAFPVGIGLALVLGVMINYMGSAKGDPVLLFCGVLLVAVAIIVNALAYNKMTKSKKVSSKGIMISLTAGILMSFFYRFVAASMDLDNFVSPAAGKMTPYSAMFIFACGIFVSNFIFNTFVMRKPFEGDPVSYRNYFNGVFKIHIVGVLGGLIWGLGNAFNLIAAGMAGAAISYGLGQGATLVSALWGVFIWKEFKDASKKTNVYLFAMFIFFMLGLGLIIAAGTKQQDQQPQPVSIIFDTDMGPDYDDVGALAVLHALADSGEVKILATVSSNMYAYSVPCIELINQYFKRPDLPLGAPRKGPDEIDPRFVNTDDYWPEFLAAKYPHTIKSSADAPDAMQVYRRILSNQPDTSVNIITVGFFTNLAALLHSPPDQFSDLDGKSLVKKKVRRLISTAGFFPEGREYNVIVDSIASMTVFNEWPTPILISNYQLGEDILTGLRLVATHVQNNPVKDVFNRGLKVDVNGRYSWDQTTVLVGVRGHQKYFDTVKGRMIVLPNGNNIWQDDPNGPHDYLVHKMPKEQLTRLIEDLMMHLP